MQLKHKWSSLSVLGLIAAGVGCVIAWAAPPPEFQITSLRPNAVVPGEVVELAGTGADATGTLQVEVLTNQWYLQDCTPRINPDSSWTCGPIHLAGKGPYNNHTIRASVIKDGKIVKSITIAGIIRRP